MLVKALPRPLIAILLRHKAHSLNGIVDHSESHVYGHNFRLTDLNPSPAARHVV